MWVIRGALLLMMFAIGWGVYGYLFAPKVIVVQSDARRARVDNLYRSLPGKNSWSDQVAQLCSTNSRCRADSSDMENVFSAARLRVDAVYNSYAFGDAEAVFEEHYKKALDAVRGASAQWAALIRNYS